MKSKYISLSIMVTFSIWICSIQFGFNQPLQSDYAQMQKHGDVQGIINAMTHLLVLEPNEARQDTLAALYMNEGKYIQALNILGIQKEDTDSDMAIEVKAVSLKSLNEPARALEHYEFVSAQS